MFQIKLSIQKSNNCKWRGQEGGAIYCVSCVNLGAERTFSNVPDKNTVWSQIAPFRLKRKKGKTTRYVPFLLHIMSVWEAVFILRMGLEMSSLLCPQQAPCPPCKRISNCLNTTFHTPKQESTFHTFKIGLAPTREVAGLVNSIHASHTNHRPYTGLHKEQLVPAWQQPRDSGGLPSPASWFAFNEKQGGGPSWPSLFSLQNGVSLANTYSKPPSHQTPMWGNSAGRAFFRSVALRGNNSHEQV